MKEKSCGAIVYRKKDDNIEFLLVHQTNGHYSFPKGHMEDGETEIETTLREIKEETNLDVKLNTDFRISIEYLLESKNVMKEVVYFLAIPTSEELKNQEGEIDECLWNNYEDTMNLLEFDNTKEVLKKAYDFIKNKKGIDK